MIEKHIYKALKQLKNNKLQFEKRSLICNKLADMGFIRPISKNNLICGYELTINGKVFIWDTENWKL
jgi:hypothetical protein